MNDDARTDDLAATVRGLELRCRILQETVRMQGRFADIAGILSSAVDLSKLASSLLNGVFSATGIDAGAFLLHDPKGGFPVITAQGLGIAGSGARCIEGLASRASGSHDIVTMECVEEGLSFDGDRAADGPLRPVMLAAVACHYEGAVNSVLVFASGRPISIESLSFINALSKNVGLSVNNALSYEKIRRTTEELDGERNKLNAVMYNMADGLLVTDIDGAVIRANRAFLEMFGYGKENLAGKDAGTLFSPVLRNLVVAGRATTKRNAVSSELDLPDGRTAKALATPLVQETAAGDVCNGVVIILRDVTHEKEAEQMKTDFLTTVSHELRTPLTSVLGFARIIRKKMRDAILPRLAEGDETVRKAAGQVNDNIDIIVSEGGRLTELIDNILDLAKLEAGKFELRKEPVSAEAIIDCAVSATAALAEQKSLKLLIEVDAPLPPVHGDRNRLIQVVINLIANAVKFTDAGSITCKAAGTGDMVVISVQDTGTGIDAADIPRIFEKFKQAGDSLTNKPKGTGLGLPICKEIVSNHGGTIWVESVPGRGSTFSFALPVSVVR